jgi:uroporphyrin-III C-methyltransferase/precorrin-2 dehydrogenase/sirohydrochlorin ferrochelatase
MRFLPVFLDLQSGVVLLVGAGDLVRELLLASAGHRSAGLRPTAIMILLA